MDLDLDLDRTRAAFFDATAMAASVLHRGEVAARWEAPSALAGFTVGGLAGHLYAAVRRLEAGLDQELPADASTVGLVEFYGVNRIGDPADLDGGLPRLIRDDGESRAGRGPDDVAGRFDAVVARLAARLPGEPATRSVPVVNVPGGITSLATYLATRVVEVVVHADDLAVSAGTEPPTVPPAAADVTIDVFVALARARSGDLGIIRAFARTERAEPDAIRVL